MVPAVVLWVLSFICALAVVWCFGVLVYFNIRLRWLKPDPDFLRIIHEKFFSALAMMSVIGITASAISGRRAGTFWSKGMWKQALIWTVVFAIILLVAFVCGYYAP